MDIGSPQIGGYMEGCSLLRSKLGSPCFGKLPSVIATKEGKEARAEIANAAYSRLQYHEV